MRLTLLPRAGYKRMPWKNGRGVTEEIAISGGEPFAWRVSAAQITEAGPFSFFPGYQRVLIVTEGDGLLLLRGDERIELPPLTPFHFSGDEAISSGPGPVRDFNVIYKAGCTVTCVSLLHAQLWSTATRELWTCVRGAIRADGVEVGSGDSLWAQPGPALPVTPLQGDTVIVRVALPGF